MKNNLVKISKAVLESIDLKKIRGGNGEGNFTPGCIDCSCPPVANDGCIDGSGVPTAS
jgi:hypothetical protein